MLSLTCISVLEDGALAAIAQQYQWISVLGQARGCSRDREWWCGHCYRILEMVGLAIVCHSVKHH
jgi:hypothetical protein